MSLDSSLAQLSMSCLLEMLRLLQIGTTSMIVLKSDSPVQLVASQPDFSFAGKDKAEASLSDSCLKTARWS
jgi:hypothetical protein